MASSDGQRLSLSLSSSTPALLRGSAVARGSSKTLQAGALASLSKSPSTPVLENVSSPKRGRTISGDGSPGEMRLSHTDRGYADAHRPTALSQQSSPRSLPSQPTSPTLTSTSYDMTTQQQRQMVSLQLRDTSSSSLGNLEYPATPAMLQTPTFSSPTNPTKFRRMSAMTSKATAVLKRIKFFQELEAGVQRKLPSIVKFERFLADTVIFQQDDPPGSCYVLLNGEVGVYTKRGEEDFNFEEWDEAADWTSGRRPSKLGRRPSNFRRPSKIYEQAPSDQASRQTSKRQMDEMLPEAIGDELQSDVDARRNLLHDGSSGEEQEEEEDETIKARASGPEVIKAKQTVEGFSVYSSFEELGKQVAVLRGGTIFGELALINDQPRGASIRVKDDCDCLVIRRADFDRVLKEEMMRAGDEKLNFLSMHMPGMKDLEIPRFAQGKVITHPAYFLRRCTYRRGHQFLTQGEVAQDAIYVIFRGKTEIRHRDLASPASPSSGITNSVAGCLQNMANRRRGNANRTFGYVKDPRTPRTETSEEKLGSRTLGTLMTGSVFGSLPMQAPEPYTVLVASASCEVFQATGQDVAKLPRRLLESVREYIAHSTAWRVRTYMTQKGVIELPKAATRSESPTVSGARTAQEAKYMSLIHAT